MTAEAVDVMVVMPVLSPRNGWDWHAQADGQTGQGRGLSPGSYKVTSTGGARARRLPPGRRITYRATRRCRPLIRVRPGGRTSPSNIPAALTRCAAAHGTER